MAGEAVTWGELLARTRKMLMDEAGYHPGRAIRWEDSELLRFLFSGVTELEKIRPSVRYQGMRLVDRQFPELPVEATEAQIAAASAQPVRLDIHYHDGLVHYAVYRAFEMDENDATPSYRANMHKKRFQEAAAT